MGRKNIHTCVSTVNEYGLYDREERKIRKTMKEYGLIIHLSLVTV
jgi:hypothetical protein